MKFRPNIHTPRRAPLVQVISQRFMPGLLQRVLMVISFMAVFHAAAYAAGPEKSWRLTGIDTAAARQLITEYATTGLEGLWVASEDGGTVAILPAGAPGMATPADMRADITVLFVIVEAASPTLDPGTVFGWAEPTAKPDKWDAYLFTDQRGETLCMPRRFTLTRTDDCHLSLASAETGIKLRPRFSIPFLGRWGISFTNDRERDLDGFIRIWPPSALTPPLTPTYL